MKTEIIDGATERWFDILVNGRPVLTLFGTEFAVVLEAIKTLGSDNFTTSQRLSDDD